MKEKHNKRLMMFENVIAVMDKHLKTWIGVPELSRTYDDFVKNYKKLTDLKLEEDNDLRPFVDRYMSKRRDLISKVIPVASVISVYAYDRGDKKLEKKTSIPAEQVEKFKDKALLELTDSIIKVAFPLEKPDETRKQKGKKVKKTLAEYGLTEPMIDDLKVARKELWESKKSLKEAEKFKAKCARDIVKISKSNNSLLKARMDRMVNLFSQKDAGFFNDYLVARGKKEDVKKPEAKKATPARKPAAKPATKPPASRTKAKPAATKSSASKQGSQTQRKSPASKPPARGSGESGKS